MNEQEIQIAQILWSTNVELSAFCKKLRNKKSPLTNLDMASLVSNLERRHHALNRRLQDVLKSNADYTIPIEYSKQLIEDMSFLQTDRATKAKVEIATGHQTAFWSVLKKLEATLRPPDRARIRDEDKRAA